MYNRSTLNIGFACIVHLYISLLIRSHCLSNISRALKGGLISKCYERGVNLTWNLDFQWQSLNTTIHNKLRLYIKENQNMVYVVLGFFLLFVTFSWCIICSFPQNVWKQQMLKFFLNHKGTLFEEHTLWHQCLALFAWIGLKEETSNTPTMLHVFPETDSVNVSPWLLLTYDV